MKKIFTLLSAALLAGSAFAQGDVTTTTAVANIKNGNGQYTYNYNFDVTVVKNGDFHYTFSNLLNSGADVEFEWNNDAFKGDGWFTVVDFVGNVEIDDAKQWAYPLAGQERPVFDFTIPATEDTAAETVEASNLGMWIGYTWVMKNAENKYQAQFNGRFRDTKGYLNYFVINVSFADFIAPEAPETPEWNPGEGNVSVVPVAGQSHYDWDYNYDAEITENEDGSYTMNKLITLESPISFTIGDFDEEGKAAVTFTENVTYKMSAYGMLYIQKDGGYATCALPNPEAKEINLYPFYFVNGNNYVYKSDDAEKGAYKAQFLVKGASNGISYQAYVTYYFGEEEAEEEEGVTTVEIYNWDQTKAYVPYETTVTENEEGVWTIGDVFGIGSVDFTFDSETLANATITYTQFSGDNIKAGGDYSYLLNSKGGYASGYLYSEDDPETKLPTGTIAFYNAYCYITYSEEPQYGKYLFTGFMYGTKISPLMMFYFGPKSTSGVEEIEAVETNEAPVEYYNLQGVRVANPSNGIFVRRQGNDVKKVVIK